MELSLIYTCLGRTVIGMLELECWNCMSYLDSSFMVLLLICQFGWLGWMVEYSFET